MSKDDFTPRNVAKWLATSVIAHKTAKASSRIITDNTRFEEDDKIVEYPSHMIGWYVSSKLRPLSDKAVDATADWIAARREAKSDKKDTPK